MTPSGTGPSRTSGLTSRVVCAIREPSARGRVSEVIRYSRSPTVTPWQETYRKAVSCGLAGEEELLHGAHDRADARVLPFREAVAGVQRFDRVAGLGEGVPDQFDVPVDEAERGKRRERVSSRSRNAVRPTPMSSARRLPVSGSSVVSAGCAVVELTRTPNSPVWRPWKDMIPERPAGLGAPG